MILFCCLLTTAAFAQPAVCPSGDPTATPGFYKDLLIDRGIGLETHFNAVIGDELGFCVDLLPATKDAYIDQTLEQNLLLVGSATDTNGILLYPDGEPRFRMVWVMGGIATDHGISLGAEGRNRFKTFYDNGGSYSGSCAGAFIADSNSQTFFSLWNARQLPTEHTFNDPVIDHDVQVTPNSPLIGLSGFNFSPSQVLSSVRHVGGGYLFQMPSGTEILLTYKNMFQTIIDHVEGKPVSWAYKPSAESGRLVNIGSHPEQGHNAGAIEISKAMLTYALAGQGDPEIKTTLANGRPWCMNRASEDADPSHTRIGDRQYHHFEVELSHASPIQIDLEEEAGWNDEAFDLHVYVASGELAYANTPNLVAADTSAGLAKSLTTAVLPAGTYYIGVTCPNTVLFNNNVYDPYDGSTAVLNGVAYRIRATWDGQQAGPYIQNLAASYCNTDPSVGLIGWPAGGVFQGPGVQGATFSPASLSAGTYTLTYTLDCTTVSYDVEIMEPPSQPQNLQEADVHVRPSGPQSCLAGVLLSVDPVGGDVTYHWEIANPKSGYFKCTSDNFTTLVIDPSVGSVMVRVSAVNECGQGTPTPWLTVYP